MDLRYYLVNEKNGQKVELSGIARDIVTDRTPGNIWTNERRTNAQEMFDICENILSKPQPSLKSQINLMLVYRTVALGGVSRPIKPFVAKPLIYKAKSIDPDLIKEDDKLRRLTGLLPTNMRLSKSKINDTVKDVAIELSYQEVDTSLGNKSCFLYFKEENSKVVFKWDESLPKGYTKATFCADKKGNPYIADWDLVTIALSQECINRMKNSIKSKESKEVKELLQVISNTGKDEDSTGYLPNWLNEAIKQQQEKTTGYSVTRHGPESLYCGNDITEDSFCIFSNLKLPNIEQVPNENYLYKTDWKGLENLLKDSQWVFYSFDNFDGKKHDIVNYEAQQKKLNEKLLSLLNSPSVQ